MELDYDTALPDIFVTGIIYMQDPNFGQDCETWTGAVHLARSRNRVCIVSYGSDHEKDAKQKK